MRWKSMSYSCSCLDKWSACSDNELCEGVVITCRHAVNMYGRKASMDKRDDCEEACIR